MLMDSFEIENFRSLKHLKLEKLARVNLLLGKNNSGKTSVLEGIFALSSAEMAHWVTIIDRNIGLEKSDIRYLFYNFNDAVRITLLAKYRDEEVKDNNQEEAFIRTTLQTRDYILLNNSEVTGRERRPTKRLPATAIVVNLYNSNIPHGVAFELEVNTKSASEDDELFITALSEEAESVLNEGMDFIAYSRTIVSFIDTKSRLYGLSQRLEEMKIRKESDYMVNVLKNIDSRITSVDVVGADIYLDLGQDFRMLMPLKLMGDGIQRLLLVVAFLSERQGGMVLIDEIDNGLHYSALRILWKGILQAAQLYDVQVFITTHSAEALRHLTWVLDEEENAQYRNEVAAYTLIRAKDDEVKSYRYNYGQLEFALERGIEVRN